MAKPKITKETTIGKLLEKYPETAKVIEKYFAGECLMCPAIRFETLELGAKRHGVKIKELLEEIKKVISR